MPTSRPGKVDYGIDAPGVIRNLAVIGVILLVLGRYVPSLRIGPVTFVLRSMAWTTGIALLVEAVLMVVYSKSGKLRHRDRMLNFVDWKGNESVLDVGTGRGLMLIGAAKRLTTGKAVGIDIWSAKDLTQNSPEKTVQNAELEGVSGKVEVQSGDAAALPFSDNSFDVILSNLCIHNIPSKAARDKACREIVRVLKPGGKAVISDYIKTAEYAEVFESVGATTKRTGFDFLFTFPPLRIVEVHKG